MPRGASVRKRGQLPVPSCQFVGCACAPCLCPGSVVRGAHPTKSDHKRLAQQVCHPERSEGSRGQILRCAQNDTSEQFIGCACAPCLCLGSVVRGAHPTSSWLLAPDPCLF